MIRLFCFFIIFISCETYAKPLARTIVALYNSENKKVKEDEHLFRLAFEMPLNHLGYKLEVFDIEDGIPKIDFPYAGLITWFNGPIMKDPNSYLDWLEGQIKSGKKVLIIGDIGTESVLEKAGVLRRVKRIFRLLGLKYEDQWHSFPADLSFQTYDENITSFEKPKHFYAKNFREIRVMPGHKPLLIAKAKKFNQLVLLSIHEKGAYAAYDHFFYQKGSLNFWAVNPFLFFEKFLACGDLPKPDTTTHMGKRIYYSQLDGEGWLSLTGLEKYRDQRVLTAEVLYRDVLKQYPDLPLTIAPIAAEINPDAKGNKRAVEVLEKMAKLDHVEFGSHGYTHVLDWDYYGDFYQGKKAKTPKDIAKKEDDYAGDYEKPRTYMWEDFSLEREISGSVAYLNKIISPKHVKIFQWSGNAMPFKQSLAMCKHLNLPNINGGDSIFDENHKSYRFVAPLGRKVGPFYQIYASMSNEVPYIHKWKEKFFGLQNVIITYENTEMPLRIKPMNLYYHTYSCARIDSFNALLNVLKYVRNQKPFAMHTSDFSRLARSFYDIAFENVGEQAWRIKNRGTLQTIRFDHGTYKQCDFEKSVGVLGQYHEKDVLYVALDRNIQEPLIVLKKGHEKTVRPYLKQSTWDAYNFKQYNNLIEMDVQGFGNLDMLWFSGLNGTFDATLYDKNTDVVIATAKGAMIDHSFPLSIVANGLNPLKLKIRFHKA